MDVYEFDEMAEAAVKGWNDVPLPCVIHECHESFCRCPVTAACWDDCQDA